MKSFSKESERIEFKQSLAESKDIVKTVAAFSNTHGGNIYVGIQDDGTVSGVEIGKNSVEKLANSIKQNTDPCIYPLINVKEKAGKKIIDITVSENDSKPVFAFGRAYKRVGKTNQRLGQNEIRKLSLQSANMSWDCQICRDASLEDIDEEKVRYFLKTAGRKRDLDIKYDSIEEALLKLEVLKKEGLTNVCVLMFAKDPLRFFLQSEVKCGRFKGITTREFIDMAEFSGSVQEQIDRAEKFVLRNIKKTAWIEPGTMERQEKWEYPLDAIREAVTNAIAHRDYRSTSGVQIRIFDDRIQVWNPGTLPEGWTIETLKKEHESKPYNPLLARMLFLIKYIEKWGRGTTDIVNDCITHGLPEPDFEDTGTAIVVTFWKSKLTADRIEQLDLNERQIKAVEYLKENKTITRLTYESYFHCSKKTAYNDLQDLMDKEIINRKGEGKNIYYEIIL